MNFNANFFYLCSYKKKRNIWFICTMLHSAAVVDKESDPYLLIMTPDTASSSAAMRAEVPTDRPRARWERDGWGGQRVTSTRQEETTPLHTC